MKPTNAQRRKIIELIRNEGRGSNALNHQMSGIDGQGHPESMTAEGAANTLKYIADDHPCCAHALKEITLWLESLCPKCNAPMTYYDGWNCPTENCDTNQPT